MTGLFPAIPIALLLPFVPGNPSAGGKCELRELCAGPASPPFLPRFDSHHHRGHPPFRVRLRGGVWHVAGDGDPGCPWIARRKSERAFQGNGQTDWANNAILKKLPRHPLRKKKNSTRS